MGVVSKILEIALKASFLLSLSKILSISLVAVISSTTTHSLAPDLLAHFQLNKKLLKSFSSSAPYYHNKPVYKLPAICMQLTECCAALTLPSPD